MGKYYKYRIAGFLNGKAVYAPTDTVGGRDLAIEEETPGGKHYLRGATPEEKAAWRQFLKDCKRFQEITRGY